MADNVIIINKEIVGEKTYYSIKLLSGEHLFNGKCSNSRFKDVIKRLQYEYPNYPQHEHTAEIDSETKYILK